MLWKITKRFQFAADQYIPDALVFTIVLTLLMFVLGLIFTGSGPMVLINGWYNGLWTQIGFAFQMSLMVLFTSSAAQSPQIERLLTKLSMIPKSRNSAILLIMVLGFITSCFINWAFCLILVPIFSKQVCKVNKEIHYPSIIAAGYVTMNLGQTINPSESAYALLATEGHFLQDKIGVLTQNLTTYNPVNLTVFLTTAVVITLFAVLIKPSKEEIITLDFDNVESDIENKIHGSINMKNNKKTVADRLNENKVLLPIFGLVGLIIIGRSIATNGIIGSLNFNFVIFLFLVMNFFLYNSPVKFIQAIEEAVKSVPGIMIQFPLYGGIMGMMTQSGLTNVIAAYLAEISTLRSFPITSFFSGAIVNLFIPSQGGQWMVQGPVLVEAGEALNANIPVMISAFVHGDEVTNLINPLYAIPVLAVAGLKLKDIWGFMAFFCVTWMIIASALLSFLPQLFGMM